MTWEIYEWSARHEIGAGQRELNVGPALVHIELAFVHVVFRYPITAICGLTRSKPGLTSAPRLPQP